MEFVKQLVSRSSLTHIIAGVRNLSSAHLLYELKKEFPNQIDIITLDVSSIESIRSAVKEVENLDIITSSESGGIDILINNAGVLEGGWVNAIKGSIEELQSNMQINLYGVVSTTQAFLPLLLKGNQKKIFTISSLSGSIGGILSESSFATPYCVSKAAVNMWLVKLSRDLSKEGFTVIPIHPGYVKTDMNGGSEGSAEIFADESVRKM